VDIENNELEIEPFDLIISTCSLHHWRNPANVLKAAKKLLKQNGRIWIMDDAAEATNEQRKNWIALVQKAAGNRLMFRAVYSFESCFLAYSREELTGLEKPAGLRLADWKILESPFFIAKFEPSPQD
jgi:SAM-dependent methyltransferase